MKTLVKAIKFICLLVLGFTTACAGATPKPATTQLRISYKLWQGDYTLLVAQQMGYFAKYGLNVVPVRYDTAAQASRDLASLELDGGLFTMSDFLLATNLIGMKAVYVNDNGGVYTVVAAPSLKTVTDLRGKRIGLNMHTAGELFITNMLQSGRMTSTDVTFVEMSPFQVANSISTSADAALVWEPYTSQALAKGEKVIYQSATNSALVPNLIAFRTSVVQQHPEAIRNFLLAWQEGVDYRLSHQAESLAIISKATGLSSDILWLTKDITLYKTEDNKALFADTTGKDKKSIYYIATINQNFLVTNGYITFPNDLQSLLDPAYLK